MAQLQAGHGEEIGTDGYDRRFWALTLGCIGVVYGDIGTSPLYAFREAVVVARDAGISSGESVIAVLSLIVWTLMLIVTIKYVLVLLNADNKGEGGMFALMALGQSVAKRSAPLILGLGIAGASFFFGDAVITPAISVMSAVEGLKLVSPVFDHLVVPLSVAIIFALFLAQSHGTAKVAQFFGPITVVWFLVVAAGGLVHMADDFSVLRALPRCSSTTSARVR
jgi:KUP system potassium uptake protein